ncbi:MAG: type V CRISPR-associated protein Cas12a/Cpf1 [Bacteroidales bacterium]|jgi:CRISPR-associated protein Cpf1|nr:type V CRISPR-associated protein Cas12a/Cpf1 [Bacteroidales bacterium]
MKNFTNLYSLSKTLRFELKPVGKTLTHIEESGILSDQEQYRGKSDIIRAESYKKVKKIIDEYHKNFIENILNDFSFDENDLNKYLNLYSKKEKSDAEKKELETLQNELRKSISEKFTKNINYDKISKEGEGIKALMTYVENDNLKKQLVSEFDKFSTYFGGFYKNRQNMYSAEDKTTAIAHRIIHDNLPKFIGNISVFAKIKSKLDDIKDVPQLQDNTLVNLKKELKLSERYFVLNSYSKTVTQKQIELYNAIIGGKNLGETTKIVGLNESISKYNQKCKGKNNLLPQFTKLHKMILSDRESLSWLPEQFNNDNEVLKDINEAYMEIPLNKIKTLLENLSNYDLSGIFLCNDTGLTNISSKYLGHWSFIHRAIEAEYENRNPKRENKSQEKYDKEKEKYVKKTDSFSIGYINECVALEPQFNGKNIENYFSSLGKTNGVEKTIFEIISDNYNNVKGILTAAYPDSKNLSQDNNTVEKIKTLLDSILNLLHFVKPLLGKKNEAEKDDRFYGNFLSLYEKLCKITALYDKVRNYITRKPYSTNKIKLNFENSTLAAGWDVNKEHDNTTVILQKGGLYYLAIMPQDSKKVLDIDVAKTDEPCFEKIEYKLLPGPNKMLPKVFFSTKGKAEFKPSREILDIYEKGCHKKGDTFDKNKMHRLIDFFKTSINKHADWKYFNFSFSDTSKYETIDQFYNEVSEQGYKITFRNISENDINKLVENGKLYLFQIYSKDFSPSSKGTPNMHTLYWKMLFDTTNLQDVVYKLNGNAEIFYRPSSVVNPVIHRANEPIENKNPDNIKKQSVFEYDIIKNRRYTENKFIFHVPIDINFKARGKENINEQVNEFIKGSGIKHIIGIDRGERHLLYLSLIDLNGKIIKQFSLNEIINRYEQGQQIKTDYHKLLEKKEGDRENARKNWKTIENIKELKEGYISQVVHEIAKLVVEYRAIVVLEDLNLGFKRSRQKVEKQVYQKFEKMLIDKLNYLVDKKKDASADGGLLKAYQLTNKFESFQKMGKQNGFLFYVPAHSTSKICPITGFVNMFYTTYESIDKAKVFFDKFKDIRYNSSKKYFEFEVDDYTKFNPKTADTRQNWVICTYGKRIETFRNPEKNNKWDNREINITEELKKLFNSDDFDKWLKNNADLKKYISKQTEKEFFDRLLHLFKLTVQMRNSITGTTTDYMISPVSDSKGEFFDTREISANATEAKPATLPTDADANGAYNIARKGLWCVKQIQDADDLRKVKLAISNKEWLRFVQ